MALFSEPMRGKYVENMIYTHCWHDNRGKQTSRSHSLPCVRWEGGRGEGARGKYSFSIFWNATLENGKKDIESGKYLRRRRNENVFHDISPFF